MDEEGVGWTKRTGRHERKGWRSVRKTPIMYVCKKGAFPRRRMSASIETSRKLVVCKKGGVGERD
jgi:hypothetical protein